MHKPDMLNPKRITDNDTQLLVASHRLYYFGAKGMTRHEKRSVVYKKNSIHMIIFLHNKEMFLAAKE